jgi:hypothetical protein
MSKIRPVENGFVRFLVFLGFIDRERDHGHRGFARLWRTFFIQLRAMILIWIGMVVVFGVALVFVRIGQSPMMIVVCLSVAVVIALTLVRWPITLSESKIVKQGNQIELPKPNTATLPAGLRPFDDVARDSTRDVLSRGEFAQDCIERSSKEFIVVHTVTIEFVSVADRMIITLKDVYVNSALRANLDKQLEALRNAAVNGVASIADSRRIASLIQSVTEAVRSLLDLEKRDRGAASK